MEVKDLEHALKQIKEGLVPIVLARKDLGTFCVFGETREVLKNHKGKILGLIKGSPDDLELPNDYLISIDWFNNEDIRFIQNYLGLEQLNYQEISIIGYTALETHST